nr:MAG TPA: hypothetical protein [Caudoviricetes sp.]
MANQSSLDKLVSLLAAAIKEDTKEEAATAPATAAAHAEEAQKEETQATPAPPTPAPETPTKTVENPAASGPAEEGKDDEATKALAEAEEKLRKERQKLAREQVKHSFASAGLDKDTFEAVGDFLDWGKITSEEGDLSQETIEKLILAFKAVATKTPPKKSKPASTSAPSGIGKYLPS